MNYKNKEISILLDCYLEFGKHKGVPFRDLQLSYAQWCVDNITEGKNFETGGVKRLKTLLEYGYKFEQEESQEEFTNFTFDDIPF